MILQCSLSPAGGDEYISFWDQMRKCERNLYTGERLFYAGSCLFPLYTFMSPSRFPIVQPPSPHRQLLQPHRTRPDICKKGDRSDNHTQYVRNVVSIPLDHTCSFASLAPIPVNVRDTRERLGDERVGVGEVLGKR